jgi:hypothetical protein
MSRKVREVSDISWVNLREGWKLEFVQGAGPELNAVINKALEQGGAWSSVLGKYLGLDVSNKEAGKAGPHTSPWPLH